MGSYGSRSAMHQTERDPNQHWLTPRLVVLSQFVIVVLALALWTMLGELLGIDNGFAMALFGAPLLLLSILIVVVWASFPPRRPKLPAVLGALGVLAALVLGDVYLRRAGSWLFFETRRSRAERLAQDIRAYGRIRDMSDGFRHFKTLNGSLVALSAAELDTAVRAGESATLPVERVLARDSVSQQRYEEFRRRLRDVRLIEFAVTNDYVAFVRDGMIDNLDGFVLVRPGGAPPALGSKLFGTALVELIPLGGGWYRFATT